MELLEIGYRRKLLKDIHSDTNLNRKTKSLKQNNIYKDKLYQYVKEDLLKQFSETTVKEMPLISSVNTFKTITDSRASIYKTAPERTFENANDNETEILKSIYELDYISIEDYYGEIDVLTDEMRSAKQDRKELLELFSENMLFSARAKKIWWM